MVSVTFQVSTGFFISPPSIRLIHWWCYFHSTTCDRVLLSSLPTCCLCILVLGLRSALGLHDLNQISRVHCGDFPYSPKHSRCQIIMIVVQQCAVYSLDRTSLWQNCVCYHEVYSVCRRPCVAVINIEGTGFNSPQLTVCSSQGIYSIYRP